MFGAVQGSELLSAQVVLANLLPLSALNLEQITSFIIKRVTIVSTLSPASVKE